MCYTKSCALCTTLDCQNNPRTNEMRKATWKDVIMFENCSFSTAKRILRNLKTLLGTDRVLVRDLKNYYQL